MAASLLLSSAIFSERHHSDPCSRKRARRRAAALMANKHRRTRARAFSRTQTRTRSCRAQPQHKPPTAGAADQNRPLTRKSWATPACLQTANPEVHYSNLFFIFFKKKASITIPEVSFKQQLQLVRSLNRDSVYSYRYGKFVCRPKKKLTSLPLIIIILYGADERIQEVCFHKRRG